MFGIIYRATNTQNGKVYIGQTTETLKSRKQKHKRSAKRDNYNRYFYNAIKNYGWKNFNWDQIDIAESREELDEKEIFWIKSYDSISKERGYNICIGGKGRCLIRIEDILSLVEKGYNFTEISKILKRDRGSIMEKLKFYLGEKEYKKLAKNNLNKKHKKLITLGLRKDILIDNILEKLDFTRTLNQIAKELDCSRYLVTKKLKKYFGDKEYKEIVKKLPRNIEQSRINMLRLVEKQKGQISNSAKTFIFITPNGKEIKVIGAFNKFCKENNLSKSVCRRILNGKRKNNYKDWKVYSLEPNSKQFYYNDFT